MTIADSGTHLRVTPDVAGPRDYITITGDELARGQPGQRTTCDWLAWKTEGRHAPANTRCNADAVGRFSVEHRVHRNAIPSTVQVKANYDRTATWPRSVPSRCRPPPSRSPPGEGQPGDMYHPDRRQHAGVHQVDYVEIGGTRNTDPGVNTDRDGNVTVEDVLIPGLDPGVYSVVINVDGTIAIGEVNVLAESSAAGAPAELPGAVESLGDSLVAIFHFDDVGKSLVVLRPAPRVRRPQHPDRNGQR